MSISNPTDFCPSSTDKICNWCLGSREGATGHEVSGKLPELHSKPVKIGSDLPHNEPSIAERPNWQHRRRTHAKRGCQQQQYQQLFASILGWQFVKRLIAEQCAHCFASKLNAFPFTSVWRFPNVQRSSHCHGEAIQLGPLCCCWWHFANITAYCRPYRQSNTGPVCPAFCHVNLNNFKFLFSISRQNNGPFGPQQMGAHSTAAERMAITAAAMQFMAATAAANGSASNGVNGQNPLMPHSMFPFSSGEYMLWMNYLNFKEFIRLGHSHRFRLISWPMDKAALKMIRTGLQKLQMCHHLLPMAILNVRGK